MPKLSDRTHSLILSALGSPEAAKEFIDFIEAEIDKVVGERIATMFAGFRAELDTLKAHMDADSGLTEKDWEAAVPSTPILSLED